MSDKDLGNLIMDVGCVILSVAILEICLHNIAYGVFDIMLKISS